LAVYVIVWLDTRTAETVDRLVAKAPGHNKDFLRVSSSSSLLAVLDDGDVIMWLTDTFEGWQWCWWW